MTIFFRWVATVALPVAIPRRTFRTRNVRAVRKLLVLADEIGSLRFDPPLAAGWR